MSFKPESAALRALSARRVWAVTALAFAAAMPGAASAGVAGVVSTSVKALSNQVTYSSVAPSGASLVTYIGYEFTTVYDPAATNTTNGVQLIGDIVVTDPAELATLTLDTANSPGFCSAQTLADRIRLVCTLGQVRAGSPDIVFPVFFKAPRKADGNGVADVDGSDFVELSGRTIYAEGSDGAGNTNNSAGWTADAPTTVALGTVVTGRIKSVLPGSGGRLFSGNGGIASANDLFGTDVTVPRYGSYTTAEILEGVEDTSVCTSGVFDTLACYTLDLTINDGAGATVLFADKLSIKVSIDGSIIPAKYKPQDLTIKYEGVMVGNCPALGVPLANGLPCINSAVRIKDRKDPARDGDIEIEFLNFQNGRFSIG